MRYLAFAFLLIGCSALAQKKKIQPSQLPEKALTFIESNFTSVALRQCLQFTEGETVRYKAVLADDTEIDLDQDGNWKEVDGKVHSVQPAFLGKPIIDYIKTNAPGERLLKASNEGKTVSVTLVNGKTFTFDAVSGKFLR